VAKESASELYLLSSTEDPQPKLVFLFLCQEKTSPNLPRITHKLSIYMLLIKLESHLPAPLHLSLTQDPKELGKQLRHHRLIALLRFCLLAPIFPQYPLISRLAVNHSFLSHHPQISIFALPTFLYVEQVFSSALPISEANFAPSS
jgi:hypothetical protein